MANQFTIQTLVDGPRNVVVRVMGILDTSDLTAQDVLDPATLSSMMPAGDRTVLATLLDIERVEYSIEDGLEVRLLWDATTDVVAMVLNGRGKEDWRYAGGLQNNAGAGVTGKIQLTTEGWSGVKSFTLNLWCKKQGPYA